jgi:Type II secretion system (T2SS), protein F
LVTSGVPILQALNITRETAGNAAIARAIARVHDSVKEGESIVQPLEASKSFPPMVVSMLDAGTDHDRVPGRDRRHDRASSLHAAHQHHHRLATTNVIGSGDE